MNFFEKFDSFLKMATITINSVHGIEQPIEQDTANADFSVMINSPNIIYIFVGVFFGLCFLTCAILSGLVLYLSARNMGKHVRTTANGGPMAPIQGGLVVETCVSRASASMTENSVLMTSVA